MRITNGGTADAASSQDSILIGGLEYIVPPLTQEAFSSLERAARDIYSVLDGFLKMKSQISSDYKDEIQRQNPTKTDRGKIYVPQGVLSDGYLRELASNYSWLADQYQLKTLEDISNIYSKAEDFQKIVLETMQLQINVIYVMEGADSGYSQKYKTATPLVYELNSEKQLFKNGKLIALTKKLKKENSEWGKLIQGVKNNNAKQRVDVDSLINTYREIYRRKQIFQGNFKKANSSWSAAQIRRYNQDDNVLGRLTNWSDDPVTSSNNLFLLLWYPSGVQRWRALRYTNMGVVNEAYAGFVLSDNPQVIFEGNRDMEDNIDTFVTNPEVGMVAVDNEKGFFAGDIKNSGSQEYQVKGAAASMLGLSQVRDVAKVILTSIENGTFSNMTLYELKKQWNEKGVGNLADKIMQVTIDDRMRQLLKSYGVNDHLI